jgi:hypothetical protein
MASGDRYRARASECADAADSAVDPERRVTLLELARRWLRLADQVDAMRERSGLKGDSLVEEASPDQRSQ